MYYCMHVCCCYSINCMYPTCIRGFSSENCHDVGKEKLERCGYPTVKKIEDMFNHFDRIHERDRQTNRQTDRHRMTAYGCACIASRGEHRFFAVFYYPPFARRAKGEVFVLLYVCLFVRSTISQQPAGRFTPYFACGHSLGRDVSSPLLGVSDPRGGQKEGK